jgi:tripartite-type tricarboxylate transporter receptor subunit TctC
VSFAPGGLTDTIARALQARLQEGFGQPVVIENRPGAGGTIAEGLLAKAPADGYTILLSADSVPANPHLMQNLSYDTFKDLVPVSLLARIPLVMLVNTTVPAATVREFVSYAKTGGVKASYGSPGTGTSNHLYFEVFKDLTNIDLPHVAYKGGGPAMTDLMGGHIQALLISSTLAVPQVIGGKVKALAVTTTGRVSLLPDLPTVSETGLNGYDVSVWFGAFAPAGLAPALVSRISNALMNAANDPVVSEKLIQQGFVVKILRPAEFSGFVRDEISKWTKVVRQAGIKAE